MAASIITGSGERAVALDMYETAVRAEMAALARLTAGRIEQRTGDPRPWEGVYPCLANVIDRLVPRGYDRDILTDAFWRASRAGAFR